MLTSLTTLHFVRAAPLEIAPGVNPGLSFPVNLKRQSRSIWFEAHLQPHESMLRAWLNSRFPEGCDVDDIVQEVFLRALQAQEQGTLRSPKAFIFAAARNLALNQLRHRNVQRIDALVEIDTCRVLGDETDIRDAISRAQDLELLTQAIQSLPARCRQILTLRKLYGLSQKQAAAELGIAEHTVESQTTIALRKISEFFVRNGCPLRRT
jgi:RNA polymerase sigma-70 factor (ECF subfamily)